MAIKKATTKATDTKEKALNKKASDNTRVTTKKAKEPEIVVKEGVPSDHEPKHNVDKGQPNRRIRTVGVSTGITKNMGDYESLRVDCWLTDEVDEGETQQEALVRLSDIVQAQIEYEVDRIMGA